MAKETFKVACFICLSTSWETPLYGNVDKDGNRTWRCRKHLDKKPDPEVEELINVIRTGKIKEQNTLLNKKNGN